MIGKLFGVKMFDIEASSLCNLRCTFCPRDHLPKQGLMTIETFQNLLERIPLSLNTKLYFCGIGEPLLNPLLPKFIQMAKLKSPKTQLEIITNGMLLDEKHVPALLDSGLNVVFISANGIKKQTYESLMMGAKFDALLRNIGYLQEQNAIRKYPVKIAINFLLTQENHHSEGEIKSFWRNLGILHFNVINIHTRDGHHISEMTPLDQPGLHKKSCDIFEIITFTDWQGQVYYCCQDTYRRFPLGNFNQDTWRTIKRKKKQIVKKQTWLPICQQCTDTARHEKWSYVDKRCREVLLAAFKGR